MWKDYSAGYITSNRASSISIMVGAFVATLILSFLCSLFYNFWVDDIAGMIREEGDWQGRIFAEISEEDLTAINNFSNVEGAVINEELSKEGAMVVDIRFHNARRILHDMSSIINVLGLEEGAAAYHYRLLAMYFIRIPGDDAPRLMMPLYLTIVALVCISMILVIHNSFAVSMNSRIHQFGIFSSIGATPRQILTCLMQETFILALPPILLGTILGITLSFGALLGMNVIAKNVAGARPATFQYHPAVFALTFLSALITILVSAWLPARRLSKLTPLEAIRGMDELGLQKKQHPRILPALFGIEGELAGNALKAQKKALRTTSLSLTLSFLGFMMIQCFFTLADISTSHTYFERFQDAWDVMITIKDTKIEEFDHGRQLQELPGVQSSILYQRGEALCLIPKDWQSEELLALGGLEAAAGLSMSGRDDGFSAKAPLLILDDESFKGYCEQIGASPGPIGLIVVNRIWDSINSNFRYPEYIPYVKENRDFITLQSAGQDGKRVEIPVLSYTQKLPVLREEYADYGLVAVMPSSLWQELAGQLKNVKKDTFIQILAKDDATLDELKALEEAAAQIIGGNYEFESENRIQDKLSNDEIIGAYKLVLGSFCVLLALIGIANVFSNTLGFLRQRKREFARYMSVGLTREGMRRIFWIEALVLAGRPVLLTLPVTMAVVFLMIKASFLNPMEFIAAAPIVPILVFILAVFLFIALAYYIGGKRMLGINLADALRDDTMT